MLQKLRRVITPGLAAAVLAVIAIGGMGTYLLATSNAQAPQPLRQTIPPRLLRPHSLGIAPYQYIANTGSLNQTRQQSGITQFFAAFIISSGNCTPAWGGSTASGIESPRSAAIAADITALRAAGGDAAVSFGGSHGEELATTCASSDELTSAYKKVIDAYSLKRIDFDLEGSVLTNEAGNDRRARAIANLQHSYPDLQVWVTLPVTAGGLTHQGQTVIKQLRDEAVVLSGINIMAMNYNVNSKDMGRQATEAASSAWSQLRTIYPNNSQADIWKALGITVMAGQNNTLPETFTLDNARTLRTFAIQHQIGMLSLWNADRDVACPAAAVPLQVSTSCSGVMQQRFDYLHTLSIPAVE